MRQILGVGNVGKGKKGSCPCVLTENHAMKAYWGSGCITPRIIDPVN